MTIKPDIITSNGHIRLIDTKDANALADYYARNLTHFLPWEPCLLYTSDAADE